MSIYKEEGLPPRFIRYALQIEYASNKQIKDDPELKRNITRMKTFFGKRLESLEKNNVIKRGIIKNRGQLKYYLKLLGEEDLDLIHKKGHGKGHDKGVKYFINDIAYKESLKNQNKESIDFFPSDKIKAFQGKDDLEKHIIYGLSDDLFKNIFNQNDRNLVMNNLKKIDIFLDEIYKIKEKRFFEERDKLIDILQRNTKSSKIKNILSEIKDHLYGIFFNYIALNLYEGADICTSKTLFFFVFGYPLKKEININQEIRIRKNISDAMNKLFNLKDKKSVDSYLEEFCRIWSKSFFYKDYDLSLGEIKELIQWGWDNKEFIKLAIPIEIAYSKFHIYSDNYSLQNNY